MDPFDPTFQSTAVYGWKPLLTLGILSAVGAFFGGALVTALDRAIKQRSSPSPSNESNKTKS